MKTLELKLKKYVLIVEIPRLADYEFINRECKYLRVGKEEIKLNASTLDKFEFLCKGSELTEEIASELMSDFDAFNEFTLNYEYLKNFIYIVESKGFYWLENPIEKPINRDEYYKSEKVDSFEILLKEWQEEEEKTFRNHLIFVKKENLK